MASPSSKKTALAVKEVVKVYKKGVRALQGVDLEVCAGDFYGLLGPNGAGKTTLIGIISTLVNKTSGQIKVLDKNLDEQPLEIKEKLGVVPQEINLHVFEKVIDIVVNQAGYHGMPRVEAKKAAERVLKQLDLWGKRNQYTKALSGGMKRRLMIARALVHNPKILILDEPTVGIDIELRLETWKFLRKLNKEGVTIILTTHYLEEAEALCNKIGIINKGKILLSCSTKQLLRHIDKQVFIFEVDKPVKQLKTNGYTLEMIDETSFEVTIPKEKSLNDFFKILEKSRVNVVGMKNKGSRLEQLFMDVVKNGR